MPDDKDIQTKGFQPSEVLSGIRGIRSTEPESFGFAREIRTDREAESLASWFDERGALWIKSNPPKPDELTGGEHYVEIDEDSGLVFKSTLPAKDLLIMDALPRNVLTLKNGDVMPFDVVIVQPSANLKSRLGL